MKDVIDLIGRICIALISLFEAYDSVYYFRQTKAIMAGYHITWNQDLLLSGAIFLLLFGGILVLIGYRASFGSMLLLLYWIPVTFIAHSFWDDPVELRRIESIQFMKNIAIIGGMLIMLVNGSGKFSVKRLLATTRV